MENGKDMSLRPEVVTLGTFHDMPTSPMARVGMSDATAPMRKGEVFMLLRVRVTRSAGEVITTRSLLYGTMVARESSR